LNSVVIAVRRVATRCVVPLLLSAVFAGCGGGGGGGGPHVVDPPWVYIDSSSATTQSVHLDLYGKAFCDHCPPDEVAFGYCPVILGPMSSDVGIVWNNQTTGQTGDAFHAITGHCSCLFSYCTTSYSHGWTASVPLAIGPNVVEIMALDGTSPPGSDSITVTRTPAIPAGVTAEGGQGAITLWWDGVDQALSYDVYWSTSPQFTTATATRVANVVSPFRHDGLAADLTYYYAVTAVNGDFASPLSPIAWATAGWRTELLAQTAASSQFADTSIAVDSFDHVHVHSSYDEHVDDSVRQINQYLTNASGTWTSVPVAMPAWVGANIALDSHDVVHVDYLGFQGLTHAVYSTGAWDAEVVDAAGWCDSSLAVDSAGKVHLAYRANHTGPVVTSDIRYASNVSGTWSNQSVDAADLGCSPGAKALSIAVERDGVAHVAYSGAYPANGLKHATNRGGAWVVTTIDSGYIASVSAAVDANGHAHLVWCDSQSQLRYAHEDGTDVWTSETIGGEAPVTSPSLALDAAGLAHVSYATGQAGGQLRYATNAGGSWRIVRIDGPCYGRTALALDSQARVHISYFKGRDLVYATNE
jgi:hypothetical protein